MIDMEYAKKEMAASAAYIKETQGRMDAIMSILFPWVYGSNELPINLPINLQSDIWRVYQISRTGGSDWEASAVRAARFYAEQNREV